MKALTLAALFVLSACGPYWVKDPDGKKIGFCDDSALLHWQCKFDHDPKTSTVVTGGGWLPAINGGGGAIIGAGLAVGEAVK